MSDEISITIDNEEYTGWKSFSIQRSLNTLCGNFDIELVNLEDGSTNEIKTGKAVTVSIEGEQLINGYIFKRARAASGTQTTLSISGRDRTADLVDCSAIVKSNSWKDSTLEKIATDIAEPFDVFIDARIDDAKFSSFNIQSGETAFQAIERMCKQRNALPTTNRFGDLVISNFDSSSPVESIENLVYGENILLIQEIKDFDDRFSEYIVKGQDSGSGKAWNSDQLAKVGRATDDVFPTHLSALQEDIGRIQIPRYRPKVIMSESKATSKSARDRAAWEAQIRAAESSPIIVSVQGFFQSTKESTSRLLWLIGDKVNLEHSDWGINEVKLIDNITYDFSDAGQVTTMRLVDPRIYDANPDGSVVS